MDLNLTSILLIGGIVLAVFYIVKFIVSPLVKFVAGILVFVAVIFALQYFFKFDLSFVTNFLNQYINFNEWVAKFSWIINSINVIKSFLPK